MLQFNNTQQAGKGEGEERGAAVTVRRSQAMQKGKAMYYQYRGDPPSVRPSPQCSKRSNVPRCLNAATHNRGAREREMERGGRDGMPFTKTGSHSKVQVQGHGASHSDSRQASAH